MRENPNSHARNGSGKITANRLTQDVNQIHQAYPTKNHILLL